MHADLRETAVAPAVDADPVKALMAADRDGLLSYHGYVSGDRFEVDVAGRRMVLPKAEVGPAVERLRAVESLPLEFDARLVEVRDDGAYVVRVGGQLVELPADRVVDWCAGFTAALVGQGQAHAGEDQIGEIAALFERPSRDDQCRMVILGLMFGRGDAEAVKMDRLAELIGELPGVGRAPAKKTVVDALGFGGYLASGLAERMIQVFGLRWSVTAGPGVCEPVEGGAPVEPLPEMPGLLALRRIVAASRAGWLRYVDEPSPNQARWKTRRDRVYRLTVGERSYEVGADGLYAWLDGVAAFHAGRR